MDFRLLVREKHRLKQIGGIGSFVFVKKIQLVL